MIDADNERRLREGGGRLDRRLPPPPHSLFHPLYPSLPLIHFRRDTRSWRRDPLRLGGRGGAWHHGVHHVQIGADDQLDQVPDGAVRGLLRGVRGDRQVRMEKKKKAAGAVNKSMEVVRTVTTNHIRIWHDISTSKVGSYRKFDRT